MNQTVSADFDDLNRGALIGQFGGAVMDGMSWTYTNCVGPNPDQSPVLQTVIAGDLMAPAAKK